MKLAQIRLRNFRCYMHEVSINVGDLLLLVGRNDVGKSTVFEALNAFFGESKLDSDDASKSGDATDVRIICEFTDYPESIVLDKDYPTSLEDEHLLNSNGRLELHHVWDCSKKTPTSSYFAMAWHPTADGYNDLLAKKNADLKELAKQLNVDLTGIDTKVNAKIRAAIWGSSKDLCCADTLIQLDKEPGKKIWEQLKASLPSFALFRADRPSTDGDPEAQDPMKTAMKEAFKGLEPQLNAIIDDVKAEVQAIADRTVEKLREMQPELAGNLRARFSEPAWDKILKVSLTGEDEIPLNKRGSGVRRLVLLNFFRAKAEAIAHDRGDEASVIYAIEEPETAQHPSHQKMLIKALLELSESPGRQVLLTSHNPAIARRVPGHCVRYVRSTRGRKVIQELSGDIVQELAPELGVLHGHGVKLFLGVEGVNDINFLQQLSLALIADGVDIPDLLELEDKGQIVFIPCGGSNLTLWTYRLAHLNTPELHIFDGDKPENYTCAELIGTRGENCVGYCTKKLEMENYLHPVAIESARKDASGLEFGDRDDVPYLVARRINDASPTAAPWDELPEKKQKQKASHAKKWLNLEATRHMTQKLLSERDPEGEVLSWFWKIAELLRRS